jgi:hypothetical protein
MSNNKIMSGLVNLVRRHHPSSIASQIVGVQPMVKSKYSAVFKIKDPNMHIYRGSQDNVIKILSGNTIVQKDNSLIKLKGQSFKQYLDKYPSYVTVKLDMAKLVQVDEEFDAFCIGFATQHKFMTLFAPEEIVTFLMLKYDAFLPIDPVKESYFTGQNMVRLSSGLRLDGTKIGS